MTLGDVATTARFLTNTDISSYPDANLLININVWYQKVVSMILEAADDSDFDDARRTNYPVQTTPLIAGQRDYTMPVSEKVLKMKRIDVTYDGTTWVRAMPIDDGSILFGMGSDTQTDTNFSKAAPRYDIKYNSLWIYPMPLTADAVSGVLRAEWERQIQPFTSADYTSVITDSTVVLGYDDPFHPMLAEGAALEYARARQLPQLAQLTTSLVDWETRLRQHYGKKDWDTTLTLIPVYSDYTYR